MRPSILGLLDRRRSADHPGLILQRYLTGQSDPAERRALFEASLEAARSDSLRAVYSEAFKRWIGSFSTSTVQTSAELETTSRLIVGLGSENVLETGLLLHHTYGVPVIPGSALKGLASHYCHDVWGQRHSHEVAEENVPFRRSGTYHAMLFGRTDDGGAVTFHDAWMMPASLADGALCLDIMTPHHPKWQTNEAPPTDFDSPVPISFLSVIGSFDFRLSWSGPTTATIGQAEAWTELAMRLLKEALTEWGVGGKTTSGYGRFAQAGARLRSRQSSMGAGAKRATIPSPTDVVDAQLVEERTKKGGWKALHQPSGLVGPIQNSGDVPSDKGVGDTLRLIVASATDRGLAFRYPSPAEGGQAQPPAGKNKGQRRTPNSGRRT